MKKSDLKIDFTKRDVISTVCLTVVLVIVLVLGNSFGYVSADGGYEYCLNETDYRSSSVYQSNLDQVYVHWSSTQDFRSHDIFEGFQGLDFSNVVFPSGITSDDFTYYFVEWGSPRIVVYLFEEEPQMYWDGNSYFAVVHENKCYSVGVGYVTDGFSYINGFYVDDNSFSTVNLTYYAEGNLYYMSFGSLLLSNGGYYAPRNGWQAEFPNGIHSAFDFGHFNGQGTDYFENINYLANVGLNGFNNLVGVGGDDGESARNNLFLNNPQWAFNQPTNCNLLLDNDGKSVFTANSTSYQNEHQNKFSIHYDFEIVVKYDYDSASGGFGGAGHGFLLKTPVARSFRDPNNLLIGDTIKSRTGTFKYYDFTNSLSYWNQTFQQFYETGSSKSFSNILTTPQIFKSCYLVNGSGSAYNDQTFYQWWTLAQSNGPIVFDGTISGTSKVKITSLIIYCNAVLVDSSNASSGNCKYFYNFLTGESGVVDNGMATNNYPYNYESSDTGYNSAYGTSGYMVQNNNNNQSVNITNNVSSDVQNEISNIITGVDDSSSSNWVSTLQTLLQANTFITFMASTFAFMPSSFWTALSTFFITCLAFLTGFVLLRVLLDLL